MDQRAKFNLGSILLVVLLVGCDGVAAVDVADSAGTSASQEVVSTDASNAVALEVMGYFGASKNRPRPTIWADGELFGSVVAPNQFKASSGNFDELYTGGSGFLNGVPLISEAKPGDQDYNGGRWHVNVLKDDVDPAKYADADRVEDLDPADFVSTDVYFSCPMLPRRGNN